MNSHVSDGLMMVFVSITIFGLPFYKTLIACRDAIRSRQRGWIVVYLFFLAVMMGCTIWNYKIYSR